MRKLILLLSFTSCVVVPPGLEKKNADEFFFVRVVQTTCEDTVDICADRSADNMEAITMYTTDLCEDFTDSSPVVAIGSSKVLCNDSTCFSNMNKFYPNLGEDTPLKSLPSGNYSLVSFIDVNANSFPDSDEPYLCAQDVEISALKNSTRIEVIMVKLKSEAVIDD